MKKVHRKKLVAPIVIVSLMLLYFIGYAVVLCLLEEALPVPYLALGIIVPLLLSGVSLFVLVERIKEIRSGVEDDLSQY